MECVDCVRRGTNDIDNAIAHLDDTKVQLLLAKFLLGGGTFKRTKFLYVIYIGPRCNVVKRGRYIEKIGKFASQHLKGVASLTTADRASLSFESLVSQFKKIFIIDDGEFSIAKIRQEHLNRLAEEQAKMHQEKEYEKKRARLRAIQERKARSSKRGELSLARSISQNCNNSNNRTEDVMAAIRREDNAVNWAIFSPNPEKLQVVACGGGGIFELVKNLPDNKWLFGLFSISSSNAQEPERHLVFFQWIGNKVKLVRDRSSSAIYPSMKKLLSPHSHEIFLVGQADLVPSEIISKCKSAFADRKSQPENKPPKANSFTSNKKDCAGTLIDDHENMIFEYKGFESQEKQADIEPTAMECAEMSATVLSDSLDSCAELYDTEETLRLIMSFEGGLMWSLFEVS